MILLIAIVLGAADRRDLERRTRRARGRAVRLAPGSRHGGSSARSASLASPDRCRKSRAIARDRACVRRVGAAPRGRARAERSGGARRTPRAGAATPVRAAATTRRASRAAAASAATDRVRCADDSSATAASPARPRPRRESPPRRRATSLAPIRRWLFGGNTIVKAGVGILFVGLAFLAKYASEHAHLPVEVRLAAIGAAAVVLLGVGWRLRLARPDYAQVLQGGAVAVLYLTLFAAFRYYGVLAATPAFVLMVAVAALAAALAVLQDARSLAVVGALGGFATPLIVSHRVQQRRRPVRLLLRARRRHRRGGLVEDVATAQPDRLRRHLRRRHRLGRARLPARSTSRAARHS